MQRRDFLTLLAVGAGTMLPFSRAAWAATAPSSQDTRRKLIVVMLRGAADGLNIVAPVADPDYRQARPAIALATPGREGGALDLDGYFGLHPALAPLMPLWRERKLAFIHACGSPDATRSHFDAQDYMESATPGIKNTADGWMNRMAGSLPGTGGPTRAVSIGPVLPRILAGSAPAVNLASMAAASKAGVMERPALANAFDRMYLDHARFGKAYEAGRAARREVLEASNLQPAMQEGMQPGMQGGLQAEMMAADNGAPLPNGFPDDAARLAKLMRNDPHIQLAFFALGGWDTHANQGAASGQLAGRLAPLALGLTQLAQRLGPMFDDTVVVVMSEFGRTVRENGNGGTDHGHGNVMWVMGGGVTGGKVLGDWRGLSSGALYEGRDVPVTTDFRTVLAHVAQRHLRLDEQQLAQVFPGMPAGGAKLVLLS